MGLLLGGGDEFRKAQVVDLSVPGAAPLSAVAWLPFHLFAAPVFTVPASCQWSSGH